jgi:hypothetical protein
LKTLVLQTDTESTILTSGDDSGFHVKAMATSNNQCLQISTNYDSMLYIIARIKWQGMAEQPEKYNWRLNELESLES